MTKKIAVKAKKEDSKVEIVENEPVDDKLVEEESEDTTEIVVFEDELVERAYEKISDIFKKHAENAIMEVGDYLFKTFYDSKYENARNNKKCANEESLSKLINRFQKHSKHAPSRSWLFQSVRLVVQAHDIKEKLSSECFQTYEKLMLSHKVSLLSVNIEKHPKIMEDLINNAYNKKLSVCDLEDEKDIFLPKSTTPFGLLTIIRTPKLAMMDDNKEKFNIEYLKKMKPKKLEKVQKKSTDKRDELKEDLAKFEGKIPVYKDYIKRYDELINNIEVAIKGKHKKT